MDVAGGGEAGVLGRLHGHRRALAERAVEHDALAGGAGELVQHPSGADVLGQLRIRRVQRAGDDSMLRALRPLAQIDQRGTGLAHQRPGLGWRHRPALAGDLVLGQADAHVGGHGHVHHLGVGQVELPHQLDVLIDRSHLQARVVALLLADG